MKTGYREDLGEILPIDVGQRPRKVLKHFYNPPEHWGDLVGQDVAALAEEARAAGVVAAPGDDIAPEPKTRAATVLQRHHDLHYGPAYLRALEADTTCWAPESSVGPARALACAAEGVLVAFDRTPRCKVVTAFRPHLRLGSVHPTSHDFALEAKRRWRNAVDRSDSPRDLEDLIDALEGDRGDLASAWRLAVAVGHERLRSTGGSGELTARAEARLVTFPQRTVDDLLAALHEGSVLDALADAIEEGEKSEALDRLLAVADALAAATALGDEALAAELAEEAAIRASCAGPELVGLSVTAASRASVSRGVLATYWRAIAEEVVANSLRLSPPARNRAGLLSTASAWLRSQLEATQATLTTLVDQVTLAPQLLSSRSHPRAVQAGGLAPLQVALRAFVVDRDHPEGADVSDLIQRVGLRWQLAGWEEVPGDDGVLVVVVGGANVQDAQTLAAVLAAGEQVDVVSFKDAT